MSHRIPRLRRRLVSAIAACLFGLAAGAGSVLAQARTEIRMLWYSDGNEGEVMADLLRRFEAANPQIRVVFDQVAYRTVQEQLPIQLEAGAGPDIARVTDLRGPSRHWLDLRPLLRDPAYWDTNFGPFLDWMRPDSSTALPGFLTQLTITGPFVNKTLFDQARVPLPGPRATWDEWTEALTRVARATQTRIPLAIDRSGHRFAGPAISYGARFIGADGRPAVTDAGFRAMAERIARWHREGVMARDLWGGVSGTTYRGANEEFANAQVVMYMSGSWQIAQFEKQIGDSFDWWAVPNPCGTVGCVGMPGGAGLVAVRYTRHPEAVARVMEFLASEPVLREFYERALFIPAHTGIAARGVNFRSQDPRVRHALETFSAQVPTMDATAARLNAYPWSRQIFGATISRLGQVVAGELTLDQAYARIDEDLANALREAGR
jgi:alpha-1,4-digalacturonate transport system substrate-binding protein